MMFLSERHASKIQRWAKQKTLVIKLLLILVVVAFVAWLALTPMGRDQRFAILQHLFRSQQLGNVSAVEAKAFSTLVGEAISSAGIGDPVVLNADPKLGSLHFFVTDPAVQWFTRCGEGNAVYDAELAVVLIYRSLFRPIHLPKLCPAPHC